MPADGRFDTCGHVYARRVGMGVTGRFPWSWDQLDELLRDRVKAYAQAHGLTQFSRVPPDELTAMISERWAEKNPNGFKAWATGAHGEYVAGRQAYRGINPGFTRDELVARETTP